MTISKALSRTRFRALRKRFPNLDIDWEMFWHYNSGEKQYHRRYVVYFQLEDAPEAYRFLCRGCKD